jgi:DNA-binding response OmpR family regulator
VRLLIAHKSSKAQAALADAVGRSAEEPIEVIMSSHGPEALELLLQDRPPEVAFVDWDLPGIEGPEICRLVRDFHHGHDTWLVVLAGKGHADTGEAWRSGADDCLATPARAADLRACARRGVREQLAASAPVDHTDLEPDRGAPRATLDALRGAADGADDFFGFGAAGLRATVEPRSGNLTADAASREAEEPRGAAVLEAVLRQA